MANENLGDARKSKNDEFYTQYADIEKEMNAYLEFNPDVFKNKTVLLPCDDPEWSNFTKYFASQLRLLLAWIASTDFQTTHTCLKIMCVIKRISETFFIIVYECFIFIRESGIKEVTLLFGTELL